MAKKIDAYIKLQVPAGQANPSPPVGPALGQHGVNIMEFCKAFNAETQSLESGMPVPVVITVYADRSFTFITKTPPAAVLLIKKAGVPKGSGEPNKDKVGKISNSQVEEIAKIRNIKALANPYIEGVYKKNIIFDLPISKCAGISFIKCRPAMRCRIRIFCNFNIKFDT